MAKEKKAAAAANPVGEILKKSSEVIEVKLTDLVDLQGALKTTTSEDYEKFKRRVAEVGFKYAFNGWRDPADGRIYILDGHHRKKFLLRMRREGYTIPASYQCLLIAADSKREAEEELLYINSKYSTITTDGILEYINARGLDLDLLANINIKELNVAEIEIPMIAAGNLSASQNKRFSQLISGVRVIAVGCAPIQTADDEIIGLVKRYEAEYEAGTLDQARCLDVFKKALHEILD